MKTIPRHKTALLRNTLSRPLRVAMEDCVVNPSVSVFDFGCGHGDDIKFLQNLGVNSKGWDPVYCPNVEKISADVVNLGYVINVIENPQERADVLKESWKLARKVLIVSARLRSDSTKLHVDSFSDGGVTRLGTFQKFFDQSELKQWIDDTLASKCIAAAPGVFYVFHDDESRQSFVASKYRRQSAVPRISKSEALFQKHEGIFRKLMSFITVRGRLPIQAEFLEYREIIDAAGSMKRAFRVIQNVTNPEEWRKIWSERAEDLLVHLALSRFGGRPKWSDLANDLKLDVSAFFSNYKRACEKAEALLFSAGNRELIDKSCVQVGIGKLMPTALYFHISVLPKLPAILRVYEGCARAYLGAVDFANIIKLHRVEAAISYLSYPTFDLKAHPLLIGAAKVLLGSFQVKFRDFSESENPPVIHRKELFVGSEYPNREKFAALTAKEEAAGLFKDTETIGTKNGWNAALIAANMQIRGHKIILQKT